MNNKNLCDKEPFEVGDLVLMETLFSHSIKRVNRIFKTESGWKMLVDDHKWEDKNSMIKWCELVSCRNWIKI